jgi:hypothetical protein
MAAGNVFFRDKLSKIVTVFKESRCLCGEEDGGDAR